MSVEDRIARLERENRRLKIAGLLVIMTIAAVFMLGQARPPQQITAGSFVVTNPTGETVAALATSDDSGLPYLALYQPGQSFASVTIALKRSVLSDPQTPSVTRTAITPSITLDRRPLLPGSNSPMALTLDLDMFSNTPRISFTSDSGKIPLQLMSDAIIFQNANSEVIWRAP